MARQSIVSIARPYTRAIFKLALQQQTIGYWTHDLALLRDLVAHPKIKALMQNPDSLKSKALVLINLCGEEIKDQARQLLELLAKNRRLGLIGEIEAQFKALVMAHAGRVCAELVSAFPLTETQRTGLRTGLERRLGNEVEFLERVDPALIGGAVIRIGDQVIDNSLRNRLNRLSSSLLLP